VRPWFYLRSARSLGQIAPVLEIFVAGNTPPCAVLFTAGKWFEPIEIDLIVGESPQATTAVVGGAGGIAVG